MADRCIAGSGARPRLVTRIHGARLPARAGSLAPYRAPRRAARCHSTWCSPLDASANSSSAISARSKSRIWRYAASRSAAIPPARVGSSTHHTRRRPAPLTTGHVSQVGTHTVTPTSTGAAGGALTNWAIRGAHIMPQLREHPPHFRRRQRRTDSLGEDRADVSGPTTQQACGEERGIRVAAGEQEYAQRRPPFILQGRSCFSDVANAGSTPRPRRRRQSSSRARSG